MSKNNGMKTVLKKRYTVMELKSLKRFHSDRAKKFKMVP